MRQRRRGGFTLVEMLVVVAIIIVLAGIFVPVVGQAREKSRQATCLGHQRQIALALVIRAQDNEERMPAAETVWSELALPPEVLACPAADQQPNGYLYAFRLAGRRLARFTAPQATLLTVDGEYAPPAADGTSPNIWYTLEDLRPRHHGRYVASYLDGHAAMHAPPISRILISYQQDGRGKIDVMRGDGNGRRCLTRDGNDDRSPLFSPDGESIVCDTRHASAVNRSLALLSVDGRTVQPLTDGSQDCYFPNYSADGHSLYYVARAGNGSDFYRMGANGTPPTRLTTLHIPDPLVYPTPGPDGKSLLFRANQDGPFDIYLADADGDNVRNLTHSPAEDSHPQFSPGAERIVFESFRDDNYDICLMDAGGGGLRNLTHFPGPDLSPAFSWDGTQLVFSSKRDGAWGLFLLDIDEGRLRRLTTHVTMDKYPAFTWDGAHVMFMRATGGQQDIYTVNLITGELVNLTNTPDINEEYTDRIIVW